MGCGCKRAAPVRLEDVRRGRALMCHACPHARREAGAAVQCTISGRPVPEHIQSDIATCPVGYHAPVLRWLGVLWYGVPMPIRLALRGKITGPVPGCGCVRAAKDFVEQERSRWNAIFESMVPAPPEPTGCCGR